MEEEFTARAVVSEHEEPIHGLEGHAQRQDQRMLDVR
jgi:hypothetical protein